MGRVTHTMNQIRFSHRYESKIGWFRQRLPVPAFLPYHGAGWALFIKRAFGLSIWPWLGS